MKYIYFDMDNLTLFIEWLRKRPDGKYSIIIGRNNVLAKIIHALNFVRRQDPALEEWLKQKRGEGEIILALSKKMDIPQGVIRSERPLA
jgi:hypothetical protein